MSNPGDTDDTPIASVQQLADHIAEGCKPRAEYRIGTEHEKFGFDLRSHCCRRPMSPAASARCSKALAKPGEWEPILENGDADRR